MNIIECIIDMMLNNWYIKIDKYNRINAIKLLDKTIYYEDSLEFYTIIFYESDNFKDFKDGYYSMKKIKDILKYIPISEANLNEKVLITFAKELLSET